MDLNRDQLIDIALDALVPAAAEPPSRLKAVVLTAASGRRSPLGDAAWPEPVPPEVTAFSAFLQTAAELAELLGVLSAKDWQRPTRVPGRRVKDLVLHLVGVERYVLGQLGQTPPMPAPRRQDHFPVSMAAASELVAASGVELSRAWWGEVMADIAACGQLGSQHLVEYHDLALTVRGLLVVRTFELWTHGDDIRHATDRAPNDLDEARLALMSGELMRVLSLGMALTGTTQPGRTARIELTGLGAGISDVALAPGEEAGHPDIVVRVATLDLCRLASNRLPWSELDCEVEGDETLLQPILAGASAFAAD